MKQIRISQSCASDVRKAVAEFHAGVAQPDTELVMFFCSSEYDLDMLAGEMRRLFSGIPVIGCTTSGEFGPAGYRSHSIAGASFPGKDFSIATRLVTGLAGLNAAKSRSTISDLLGQLDDKSPGVDRNRCFAYLMIDGLSMREEQVAHALQHALDEIPLVGGSAGDDQKFSQTCVYHEGRFHADSAIVALFLTARPFKLFINQSFTPSECRLVVTRAEPEKRIVHEINGLPAAEEYARLIGVDVRALDSTHYADTPIVVRMGGVDFVRSIRQANPDGSLTFYCAIDEGVVFRLVHTGDMVADLEHLFGNIRDSIGEPEIVLGCDSILRKLEMSNKGTHDRVEQIFQRHHVVGFNTYGEQYRGIHVNQTLTGVAIGLEPRAEDA